MTRQFSPRVLLAAIVVPTFCGCAAIIVFTLAGCSGSGKPQASSPTPTERTTSVTPEPQIAMKRIEIDAGEVELGVPHDYEFTVENRGGQPLRLNLVRKNCSCSEVRALPEEIAPGQAEKIVIRWTPQPGMLGVVSQMMTLQTNDPSCQEVRLVIRGNINPLVRISLPNLFYVDFGNLTPSKSAEKVFKVYSTRLDHFGLEMKLVDEPGEQPAFTTTVTPLERSTRVDNQEAKCGYEVVLKTVEMMPRGYINRSLALVIKLDGEAPRTIPIPVYASLDNGVVTVGPQEIAFKTPHIADGEQTEVVVRFVVPSPGESVEVVRCEPAFLVASKPVRVKEGLWSFTLSIPKDNPEARKFQPDPFFEGKIYLRTSGSMTPLPVRVKWVPSEAKMD